VFHLPYFHSVFPFILHSLLSSFINLFPFFVFFIPYSSAFSQVFQGDSDSHTVGMILYEQNSINTLRE
jgi:hypothetical protein